MIATSIVRQVLEIELAVVIGVLSVVVLHAVTLLTYRRVREPRLRGARAVLTSALETSQLSPEGALTLGRLPAAWQIELFLDMARQLHGAWRDRLAQLAEKVGIVERAEQWCRSRFWWRRLRGARLLGLLGVRSECMMPLLADRITAVRVQAAEWCAEHPDEAVIDALLRLLGDQETLPRYTVQDSLLRMGAPVVGPLAGYLISHRGPDVVVALDVATRLADVRLLPSGLSLSRHEDPAVRARAVRLIGAIGGTDGVAALQAGLSDHDAGVRAGAAHALGRLVHWPAAAAVAPLLRDRDWEVRREAALALRDMGAPGNLFLRRMLSDPDPFAADMARQILDLPASPAVRTS